MNYVVWDIETDSAQLDWATMIEIGAILLDENFSEKERFTGSFKFDRYTLKPFCKRESADNLRRCLSGPFA